MRTSTLLSRLFLFATFTGASLLHAATKDLSTSSQDVVIVRPANLPALAQNSGQALYLKRVASTEETYLYVEQNNGAQLAVFDVTDPGKIRAFAPVALGAAEPFDFVKYLGHDVVLVRYRTSHGYALLDARKATAPVLRAASSEIYGGDLRKIGAGAYLETPSSQPVALVSAEDYRIVDLARPEQPVVLYTAKGVVDTLTRSETETTFLLGADGLTVVRHPRTEAEFTASQNTWN
jgi:hypothetical protein